MSEIIDPAPVKAMIGGEEVELSFTMASIHWLTSKHENLKAFLEKMNAKGRAELEVLNTEYVEAVADFIYAGLYRPDDNGVDQSGWTPFKVMRLVKPATLGPLTTAIWKAFNEGSPGGGNPSP